MAIHALADSAIHKCGNKGSVAMAGRSTTWWLSITDRAIRPTPDLPALMDMFRRLSAANTLRQMKVTAEASMRGESPWSQAVIRPEPRRIVSGQF